MAINPTADYSSDIRDFRRALSAELKQKLFDLEKETSRIEQILKEGPLGKPAWVHESSDGFSLLDFVPGHNRRRRLMDLRSDEFLSYKEAAERFPERKALVDSFLKNVAEDTGYVRDCFLLRSTFQYAVMRKEITYLNCDYDVLRPFTGELASPNEFASLLTQLYIAEPVLTRECLTTLSVRYGTLSLLHAVCDNVFLNCNKPSFKQAEAIIRDTILGLGDNQIALSKDLDAYMDSLGISILRDLRSYISAAKRITKNSFSRKEFPLNEDQLEMLQFGHLAFSTYPEGKEEYLKALTGALHEAAEKGYLTQNELSTINGIVTPQRVDANGSAPPQKIEDISPSAQPVTPVAASQAEVTGGNRIEFFPFLEEVIKNVDVITEVARIAVLFDLLEDDPDMVAAFKYRFTGLDELKPVGEIKKINWRLNAVQEGKTHPGELFALLKVCSKNRMFRQNSKYILHYFTFQYKIEPGHYELYEYKMPFNPQSNISPDDKFRKELLRCFEDNEELSELIRRG